MNALATAIVVFAVALPSKGLLFAASAKLVVTNARLFTMASRQRDPFLGYFVVAEDGTIATIAAGDPPSNIAADKVLNVHGQWVIPGFLSAHSHLWQAAYRGLAADKTLTGWIDDLYLKRALKATPEDLYWFCLLGSLDHLQHGITTAYDFSYSRPDWKGNDNQFDQQQFQAEVRSGMRFVHGYEPGFMVPGVTVEMAGKRLGNFLDWTRTQPQSSMYLGTMISGSTAFNNTYEQARIEKSLMDQFHLLNQSHYLEPPEEKTQQEERAKFRWFVDSGLLSQQLIFGHFIHTDDSILDRTVRSGAAMTWNPLSNGRMASGVPDIPKYLHAGLRIGMGIDGEASADLADPFECMRAGLYAVRDKYQDATVLSPHEVLLLHTMGSADVLGVKDKLGSLEPGKFADFLVIDPAGLGAALEDSYANLVLVTSQQDVAQVYVGGELKVDHGKLLQQDLPEVQKEVYRRVTEISR